MPPRRRLDDGFPWVLDDVPVGANNVVVYPQELAVWMDERGLRPHEPLRNNHRNRTVHVCNGCGQVYGVRKRYRCMQHSRDACTELRVRFGDAVPEVQAYQQMMGMRNVRGRLAAEGGAPAICQQPGCGGDDREAVGQPGQLAGVGDPQDGAGAPADAHDAADAGAPLGAAAGDHAWQQLDALVADREEPVFHDLWDDPPPMDAEDALAGERPDADAQPDLPDPARAGRRLWQQSLGLEASTQPRMCVLLRGLYALLLLPDACELLIVLCVFFLFAICM